MNTTSNPASAASAAVGKPLAGKAAFIHGFSRHRRRQRLPPGSAGWRSRGHWLWNFAIAAEALVEEIKAGGGDAIAIHADAIDALR
jgi:3-oxoacyl-[acyl-carrier protein] reductase